jgi:hypothetical protein
MPKSVSRASSHLPDESDRGIGTMLPIEEIDSIVLYCTGTGMKTNTVSASIFFTVTPGLDDMTHQHLN